MPSWYNRVLIHGVSLAPFRPHFPASIVPPDCAAMNTLRIARIPSLDLLSEFGVFVATSAGLALLCAMLATNVAAAEPTLPAAINRSVEYERDVLPLLETHCLDCHGPDEQQSGLRLDRRASLLRGGDLGQPAVTVGSSAESFVVRVVAGLEADLKMPPEGDPLSADEIAVLRAWIDQGLKMPGGDEPEPLTTDHWSFQPLAKPHVPHATDPWCTNAIDGFILAKLREKQLAPSAEADRPTLIRRVYLDVLGLLPSEQETAEFVADERTDAYERLVDRVMSSPRYGERWARHWLDVVRFADTNGFETNTPRPNAFHYRDWVIRSLNEDKPYDRFVFEQIAGDSVGVDVATGFLVGGPYDTVKSPDPNLTQMQRQDELADMINTAGATFLGLTLGCARCHSHKFDPVTQRDYYSIQAIFAGVQHGDRSLREPDDADRGARLAELRTELSRLEAELAERGIGLRPPVNARENEERFAPVMARFVRFTIKATNQGEPCIDELEVFAASAPNATPRNVALASAGATATSSGDFPNNPKHRLEHIHDGRFGNSYSWISNQNGGGWVQIELAEPTRIDHIVWQRDREQQFADRLAIDYVIEVAEQPGQWRVVAASQDRLPFQGSNDDALQKHLSELADSSDEATRARIDRWNALRVERQQLERPALVAYAGKFQSPPKTFRLYRGDPMQPREQVAPDALEVLGSLGLDFAAPEQQRRVAFANWLIAADNPLTARVMANRVWHYHFGVGLVGTPSDFGGNGARPTHPELLDWLAGELIRSGWSLKYLHRTILSSSAYRQSSRPEPRAMAVDAGSRYLWRFPPRRLEAEVIRDAVLQTSGALRLAMYGPGFSVFQDNSNYVRVYLPRENWGPNEWRRMVYRYNVRMEQGPVFGSFDCPDAGQPAPKRGSSTTAIQALNLLNSDFMVQQAELFAARVLAETSDSAVDRQVTRAFQTAFGRQPTADERAASVALVERHGLASLCRALMNANEFLFLP